MISIDELLSENEGDLPSVHITALNPLLLQKLHRQLYVIGISPQIAIQWDFPITFEMARAFQKANGRYLRESQWTDITMVMSLELG